MWGRIHAAWSVRAAGADSHNVFRSITGNTYRKVLLWRERAPGREVLQVETEAKARWKLGVFKGASLSCCCCTCISMFTRIPGPIWETGPTVRHDSVPVHPPTMNI